MTIYASLLTFWGAAWVLFIIGPHLRHSFTLLKLTKLIQDG